MTKYCECGKIMELTDTDSRQEWCEETYCCSDCDKTIINRKEFDQNGKIILDEDRE